tara:strand:+ start:177 stop:389 length:213 start_codon:yes stop_codon:yes gene_type:complete
MEYTNMIQPLTLIGVSLMIGAFMGSLWMFFIMDKSQARLREEVDKFRDLYFNELDNWKNKYDNDDDYEAY